MKNIKFRFVALNALLLATFCGAQTNTLKPSADFLGRHQESGINFSTSMTNSTLVVGITNNLRCRLENNSTNAVLYVNAPPAGLLSVFITNDLGGRYVLIESPKPKEYKMSMINAGVSAISFDPLPAHEVLEWDAPLVIDGHIPAGDYKLVAEQIIVDQNPKHEWNLTSSFNVKVIKINTHP